MGEEARNRPFLSVIIPLFNYQETIERAIVSVVGQNIEGVELIVVDDGSTDGSASVVNDLRQAYTFQFIQKENGGVSSARNLGLESTHADFILFLDADDYLLPESLSTIQKSLLASDTQVLLFGHRNIYPDGREKYSAAPNVPENKTEAFLGYARGNLGISFGSSVFHSRIFQGLQFPEGVGHAEDLPIFALIFATCEIASFDVPVCAVTKHSGSRRRNPNAAVLADESMVEMLFSHPKLPEELRGYESLYRSERRLSIFRTLYKAGLYREATSFYVSALKVYPASIGRLRYLSKFLRVLFLGRLFHRTQN